MELTRLLLLIIFLEFDHSVVQVEGRRRTKIVYKPQVDSLDGTLRGKIGKSRTKREFYQFLGIPYAEPPINERRFEPPIRPAKWSGIRYVDKHRPACLQLNLVTVRLTGQEDCLYANVFVPKTDNGPNRSNKDDDDEKTTGKQDHDEEEEEDRLDNLAQGGQDQVNLRGHGEPQPHRRGEEVEVPFSVTGNGTTRPLPVMVYIYGGYFMYGAARLYGPQYFMDEDVILVTFNYRVGALGFLNTGDSQNGRTAIKGNMGLKDQNMLLRYVQENIAQFGGDPKKVTLFGESAGASAVHLHILSKMSAGLFQKAIAQSGSAIRTWTIVKNPGEQAKRLGGQLNCSTITTDELIGCLKKVDGMKIVAAHYERLNVLSNPLAQFGPSIETTIQDSGSFLTREPLEILKSGDFSHIPLMMGVTKDEGLIYSAKIVQNYDVISKINKDWLNTAPTLLNFNQSLAETLGPAIKNFYLGHFTKNILGKLPSAHFLDFNQNFKEFTNMFSDRLYIAATRISAREHAKYAPVYAYFFSYEGEFSFYNILLSNGVTGNEPRVEQLAYSLISSWVNRNIFGTQTPRLGVCHFDDIIMLFKLRLLSNVRRREVDYPMSRAMVKSWVQFATEHQNLKFDNQVWPPINRNEESPLYMNLNVKTRGGGLVREPFTSRAKFWESIGLIA